MDADSVARKVLALVHHDQDLPTDVHHDMYMRMFRLRRAIERIVNEDGDWRRDGKMLTRDACALEVLIQEAAAHRVRRISR